jgi:H+/Cl- antiporter ClcA
MGQVIMLGTLFGLIALIYWLVLRFDPEARRSHESEVDR